MALALRPIWRARFTYLTTPSIVAAAYPMVSPPTTVLYPYPKVYSVGPTKATLLKSIVLTNLHTADLVITGIYVGLRTTEPTVVGDLTTAASGSGVVLFNRIAPKDLRVPAGQQIVIDTEVVMAGVNVTTIMVPPTIVAHNDYLVFELPLVATQLNYAMDCVVNGAERDQV